MTTRYRDDVSLTLETGISASTKGTQETLQLTSGADAILSLIRPPHAVRIWNSTDYTRPDLDPDVEEMYVVAVDAPNDQITVLRGMGNNGAPAHTTGGKTYAIWMVLSATLWENNIQAISVKDFGALGDATTDDTAAIQRAQNAAREEGYAVYFPASDGYKVAGKIEDYTGSGTKKNLNNFWFGDGYESSQILDHNTSGPCIDFDETFLNCTFRDFGVTLGVHKETQHMIRLKLGNTQGVISNVRLSGGSARARSLLRFEDTFNVNFLNLFVKNATGLGLQCNAPTVNSGNFRFFGGDWANLRCGLFANGITQNNNFSFYGTKFASIRFGPDWIRVTSLGTFTAGSTSIQLGTGHTIANSDALYIGNDNNQEVVIVSSYDSGTGLATLYTGLQNNYSGDSSVEVIGAGDIAIAFGQKVPNVSCYNCHFEAAAVILAQTPGAKLDNCIFGSFTLQGNLQANQDYPIYVLGSATFGIKVISPFYTTGQASNELIKVINSEGSGNSPGPVTCEDPILAPGSLPSGSVINTQASSPTAKYERTTNGFSSNRDLDFAGGYRHVIDDFNSPNVSAGSGPTAMLRLTSGVAFATAWIAPRAGSITAVAVKTNESRTAGTLTAEVYKNGSATGLTAVLDGTNPDFKASTQAKDTDTFAAGDELDIRVTTDGSWAPTTADIRGILEVEV